MKRSELICYLKDNGYRTDADITRPHTYADTLSMSSLTVAVDGNRLQSGWKTAEIVVAKYQDNQDLNLCLEGWKAVTHKYRNQFLCIEDNEGNMHFYTPLGVETSFESIFHISKRGGINVIYYGAPGTGKSYSIDEDLNNKKIPDSQVKRVIFYPDYTYTDFIGGLLPVTDKEEKPKYKFVAGPFTEILKDAFDNSDKSYYIVIEEINRGNPAAIFGDVFQLLDRDSSGKSRYTITNKDICSFLRDDDNTKFENDRFWIPSNLNIVCTMNTADQNVFVLDTAFKRRFKMVYVPIDFKKLQDPRLEQYKAKTKVFAGNISIKEIFDSTDLSSYVSEHESEIERNWPTFAQLVNEKINIINRNGDSISEDKKLGPFFASLDELTDRRKFADKVLYYLKQDVFKYTDSVLTPSYQKLYDDFVNGNADIFELFATAK